MRRCLLITPIAILWVLAMQRLNSLDVNFFLDSSTIFSILRKNFSSAVVFIESLRPVERHNCFSEIRPLFLSISPAFHNVETTLATLPAAQPTAIRNCV